MNLSETIAHAVSMIAILATVVACLISTDTVPGEPSREVADGIVAPSAKEEHDLALEASLPDPKAGGAVVASPQTASANVPENTRINPGHHPTVALFDGRTLDGWTKTNFGGEGTVEVRDQTIFMERGSYLTGVHRGWPDVPRVNYQIDIEAQRVEGQDFFVGMTFPVKEQFCSLILGGWGGGVCGISSIDSYDASENETTSYQRFESGKWYKVRLVVLDKEVWGWLDDELLLQFDTEGRKLDVRFEVGDSRPFGLCCFDTRAAVRNMKLTQLPPGYKPTKNSTDDKKIAP